MALRLHWPDERYVRIYVRDTLDWSALSWNAQALYVQLNRKADRRGFVSLGRLGRRGVAALVGRPDMVKDLEPALAELEADGCVRVGGDGLVIAEFIEAQEAVSSAAARTRAWREKKRAAGVAGDETSPEPDEPEKTGPGDETSRNVTPGYSAARTGTERAHSGGNGLDARPPPRPPPTEEEFAADLAAEEEQAILSVLPARTLDIARRLNLEPAAVDLALEDLRRRGRIRLDGGLVPRWEAAP